MKTTAPLPEALRAIVALSENMIDDQDPKAAFAVETVNEAARAIRSTANGMMKAAHNHDAVLSALSKLVALHDGQVFVCGCDDESMVSSLLAECRTALQKESAL